MHLSNLIVSTRKLRDVNQSSHLDKRHLARDYAKELWVKK